MVDGARERVERELSGLETRMKKLSRFIGSAEYKGLSKESRYLLRKQYKTMGEYEEILSKRLITWGRDLELGSNERETGSLSEEYCAEA